MEIKDICRLSKGKIRESDIVRQRKLGEQTIVTTKDSIWKIDGGNMRRIANRKIREGRSLREASAKFVVVQTGVDQEEYFLTSKNSLTQDPFDPDIKFFTSEEQARSFAEKAYIPTYLSEMEFEFEVKEGAIQFREINPESEQEDLEDFFLNKMGKDKSDLEGGEDDDGLGDEGFDDDLDDGADDDDLGEDDGSDDEDYSFDDDLDDGSDEDLEESTRRARRTRR